MDIMTGENLSSIMVAVFLSFIVQFVNPIEEKGGGVVISARCMFLFIREHKHLV